MAMNHRLTAQELGISALGCQFQICEPLLRQCCPKRNPKLVLEVIIFSRLVPLGLDDVFG